MAYSAKKIKIPRSQFFPRNPFISHNQKPYSFQDKAIKNLTLNTQLKIKFKMWDTGKFTNEIIVVTIVK